MNALKRIALVGAPVKRAELTERLPEVSFDLEQDTIPSHAELQELSLVIDLDLDTAFSRIGSYAPNPQLLVVGGAVSQTIHEMLSFYELPVKARFFGINHLPTCLNRPGWEVSSLRSSDRPVLEQLLERWGVEPIWVPDQIGMVSARVLCLIINEGYLMIKEGTATKEAIDLGMKLGTNYPLGPISWAEKIGLERVVSILERLYETTGEIRYMPSVGLKEALRDSKGKG